MCDRLSEAAEAPRRGAEMRGRRSGQSSDALQGTGMARRGKKHSKATTDPLTHATPRYPPNLQPIANHQPPTGHLPPCHAEIRDERVYPMLARPDKELACEVCNRPDREGSMLLCDGCGTGWHLDCLQPPLSRVPEGMWVCPMCVLAGVDASTLPVPAEPEIAPLLVTGEPMPQLEVLRYCPVGRHLQRNGQRVWGSVVEDGAVRDCVGVLTYLGHLGKEAMYRLRYEGGAVEEELSLAAVKALQPVGEAPAPGPGPAVASRGRAPALHRAGPHVAVGQAHHARGRPAGQ
jgi:hypothetical protein